MAIHKKFEAALIQCGFRPDGLLHRERDFLTVQAAAGFRGSRAKGQPLTGRQKHRLVIGLLGAANSPAVPKELQENARNLVELIELEAPGGYH